MIQSKFPWSVSAEEEYRRDPKLKREDAQTLRLWITSQNHLPTIDEEMILHLLHACYYNVEQAKVTTEALYSFKNSMPNFFNNWDTQSEDIQDIINNVALLAPLPQYDSDGNKVMVCKLNNYDPSKYNCSLCIKWLLMSSYHALWSIGIQKGYVLVYDASGFTMSHLFKCSLSDVKNYISFGERASPIRVLKIIFINTGPVVKKLMTLVKPFLNKDLINMISFHTTHETYFKDMPIDNTPADYGGTAPPLLSIHREWLKNVLSHREWMLEEEKIRCDESKRVQKGRGSPIKVEKQLKTLEID